MNRQVPKYCILGDGKLARHLIEYFTLIDIEFSQWSRSKTQNQSDLTQLLRQAEVMLLCINDDSIVRFYEEHLAELNKPCVHFSGVLYKQEILGCHPLMTFSENLYDLQTYTQIPFVVDEKQKFELLFPAFKNPVYEMKSENKILYHSMCVMAGNFPQILWDRVGQTLVQNCDLPSEITHLYLQKVLDNFVANPEKSLTGPLQRGDDQTINKHLQVLEQTNLKDLYQAFVNVYQTQNRGTQ